MWGISPHFYLDFHTFHCYIPHMKHSDIYAIAYWYLRTLDMDAAKLKVRGKTGSNAAIFQSKVFTKACKFWVENFKAGDLMDFELDDVPERAKLIMDDLQKKMTAKYVKPEEYVKYFAMWMSTMNTFGGNWSGLERNTQREIEDNQIFQGDPKYLVETNTEAAEFTEVSDNGH